MKAFLISDTHLGLGAISYDKHLKMMENYFYNFFIPLLKERAEDGDILIHLGDLYDNRSQIPIDVLNSVEKIMETISNILPVHLIIGNHDIFNKSTNDINSPKLHRWIDNINIYEETTQIKMGSKTLTLMPWVEHKEDQVKYLKKYSNSDYLFCHSDLNGCRMHLSSVAWKNKNKIDIDEFASYGKCYSGHIHIKQTNKNFTFIGSPYQMDRNDRGDRKGIYILDIETGEEEFVENTISPEFLKLEILKEEDIDKINKYDTSKNYVDIAISNSLLMNNRKLRREIELSLEKGAFTKVEYINDIKREESINENKSDEELELDAMVEDMDISDIQLDELEDIVLKYIEKQSYESDNIKESLVEEYTKILNIYRDEYKFKN